MSTAILTLALATDPRQECFDSIEVLNAFAETTSGEPVQLQLRVKTGTEKALNYSKYKKDDRLLVTGELILDESSSLPIVYANTICKAIPEQFVNEVVIVGGVGKEGKVSEKGTSLRRAIAVNRWTKSPGTTELRKLTDWFQVRSWKYQFEKMQKIPNGSLCEITGMLWPMQTHDKKPYVEVRCRTLKVHKRSGSRPDPAKETSAIGYSDSDFGQAPEFGDEPMGDLGSAQQWS